ncbi:hypothetical protein FRC09_018500 [Ceratobasidium sp. 395]|nr:hypothetical protein FRC09_018500 [Ceratobasidium sp. 395]
MGVGRKSALWICIAFPSADRIQFTQAYPGAKWFSNEPYSDENDMFLPGASADGPNAVEWIERLVEGISPIRARDASKNEVVGVYTEYTVCPLSITKFSRVKDKARGTEGCCMYFQGHGIYLSGRVNCYLTAQNSVVEGETWDGLTPNDMRKLLGLTDRLPWRIIATDGFTLIREPKQLGLQFVLYIDGSRAEWREVDGWLGDVCSSTPTVHFAGSQTNESVYEHTANGGFFTQALTKHRDEALALPNLLRIIRSEVNVFIDAAKWGGAIEDYKTQTPQIFSSVKLNLEDTHALINLQRR